MKKILHVTVSLTGEGIANYLYNYLTHIDLNKFNVDIVINNSEKIGIYEKKLKSIGINIIKITSYEKNTKEWLKQLDEIMKSQKYDIIEGHVGIRSNFICKLAKKNNIPIRVIHTHIAYEPENIIKKLFRILCNNIYSKYVTNYFGCSKDALNWTFGHLINGKKCYIINNAISIGDFLFNETDRKKYRRFFNLENDFVIGSVGRLCFQKNQVFLLEIFKNILDISNNSKLMLVGDGPDRDLIERKIEEYKIQDNVIFTGLRNDVPKLINCFDSFVLPSRYEGFGIVYLEAQINQLNCFATEERVPKQVKISSNMHFISEKLNAKEWASIIVKESLERENINKINFREFDIKEQAKKLEKIYMKL